MSRHRVDDGFSLVETMLALFIVLMILLSVAQLFGVGMYVNKAAEDVTQVTSLASAKIEELKVTPYDQLVVGGSLEADVAGYYDLPDPTGKGEVEYTRRWALTENAKIKTIEVRVIADLQAAGEVKETTVGVLVAKR